MEENKKTGTINLDEMLGAKTLTVRLHGCDYPIRMTESLSPEEIGKVILRARKFSDFTTADFKNNNGAVVTKAVDDLMDILGPELPRYKPTWRELLRFWNYTKKYAISLEEAAAIMGFWKENNRPKFLRAVKPKNKRR